jgi:outer membrane protein assembly factor BamB
MSQPPLPDQPSDANSPGRRPQSDHGDVQQPSQPDDGREGQNVSGGGGGNGKVVALIAAAVAAAVAICAVGFFLINGDVGAEGKSDEKSRSEDAGKQGKELFKIKAPNVHAIGSWVTDDVYARGTGDEIVGVDPASGKQKWKLPLDGLVCAASEHLSTSGKTAVVVAETESSDAPCSKLVVFDVNSGKKEWQKTIPNDSGGGWSSEEVTISQDIVATRSTGGDSVAYKISGGPALWQTDLLGEDDCRDKDFAGGKELTALARCHKRGDDYLEVDKLDPKTGESTWEFKLPEELQHAQIISSDPVVIAVCAELGSSRPTDMFVVGDNRKLKSRISLGELVSPRDCGLDATALSTIVDDKILYAPSQPHYEGDDRSSTTNEIRAFDLETGQRKWTSGAGHKRHISPIRMEGDTLIAYKSATDDSGGEVVAIDPATHGKKQEVYLRNPDASAALESTLGVFAAESSSLYENGRLYLQRTLIWENDEKHVSVAFGTQ